MTRSPSVGLKGSTRPRVESLPLFLSSAGQDAIDLAASAGLILDPWQEYVLENSLGERPDGKWAAYEVACNVPRQNGKGSVLEARELAGLALFGEKTLIHTAHEFKTAKEHYLRMKALIKNSYLVEEVKGYHGDADAQMGGMTQGNSSMAIEFKNGARLMFLARSKGSGRGFSGDFLALDEAYALTEGMMDAITPAMSARPNPQIWYTSSAGMPDSFVLEEIMNRGKRGDDPELAYFEYSVDPDNYDPESDEDAAVANPSAGYHKPWENIHRQRRQLTPIGYAREHLGVWEKIGGESFIPESKWRSGAITDPPQLDKVSLGVDVTPDRSSAVIASAGVDPTGRIVVGLVKHGEGTDWVAPYLRELITERGRVGIWLDGTSAASALEPDFKSAGVGKMLIARADYYRACGRFFDLVDRGQISHTDEHALNDAVSAARQGSKGDLWSWARKDTTADISPLVAATLAVHGVQKRLGTTSKGRRSSGRGSFFG